MVKNITHRQHYVPQKYLTKWLSGTELFVLDLKSNKIKQKGTNAICFQFDYYKISPLTKKERQIFSCLNIMNNKDINKFFDDLLKIPFCEVVINYDNKYILKNGKSFNEIKEAALIQLGESYMSDIERGISDDTWSKIYSCNETFIDNDQVRIDFFAYISCQIWRTPKQKLVLSNAIKKISHETNTKLNVDNFFPYFCLSQTIFYANILMSQKKYKIIYLKVNSFSNLEFITSDNPIIKIFTNENSTNVKDKYDLFWPLSPLLAMLITLRDLHTHFVNDDEIQFYNEKIKENANQYLIAYSKKIFLFKE